MKKIFLILCIALSGAFLPLAAQNRIDRMVEKFSAGKAAIKFTTAVERDPKTKRVQKVVKVLRNEDTNAYDRFFQAFKLEAQEAHDVVTIEDGRPDSKFILTVKKPGQKRIYAIQDNRKKDGSFSVYIIINYK